MKKIFLTLLLLILFGCGGPYQEADSKEIMDSISFYRDTISLNADYMEDYMEEVYIDESICLDDDKKFINIEIDTTSNLMEIRKSKELIISQQKQLDSLISKIK